MIFFFLQVRIENREKGKERMVPHLAAHSPHPLSFYSFVFRNFCFFKWLHVSCQHIFTYKSSPHDHLRAKAHRQHAFLWTLESNLAMRFWSYWKQDKWLINGIMHLSLTAIVDCTGVLLTWNCEFRGCSWSPVNCARQNGTQRNSVLSGQTRGLAHGGNIAGQHCKESSRFVCVQWSV